MTTLLTPPQATKPEPASKAQPAGGFWRNWLRHMARRALRESIDRTTWNVRAQSEFIRAWQGDRDEAPVEGSTRQDDPQEAQIG